MQCSIELQGLFIYLSIYEPLTLNQNYPLDADNKIFYDPSIVVC